MKTPCPALDLAGQVFGRLTARARAGDRGERLCPLALRLRVRRHVAHARGGPAARRDQVLRMPSARAGSGTAPARRAA